MSHYEIEDTPPQDVETQLAMYEESRKMVVEAGEKASRLLSEAEPLLKELFSAATGDAELQAAVNGAWERTQQMAVIVSQQGAALNGASAAVESLKVARDAVMGELNTIIKALDEGHAHAHPKVQQFKEDIEETLQEWIQEEAYETADEYILNEFYENLGDFVEAESSSVRFKTIYKFFNAVRGYGDGWTEEQARIFGELLETFKPSLQPIHLADDYEDDEEENF